MSSFVFSSVAVPQEPQYEMTTLTFALLVTGPTPPPADPAELQKMQAAHIQNFVDLAGQGKLLTAGPLGEGKKNLRGIVVLNTDNPDEIKGWFKNDPYVSNGIMELQAFKWYTAKGRIGTVVDPNTIGQHTFVILRAGPDKSPMSKEDAAEMQAAHLANLTKMTEDGILALAGPLLDGGDWRGILVCHPDDQKKVAAALYKDPAIKSGRLNAWMMPLWLSKGALPEPGK